MVCHGEEKYVYLHTRIFSYGSYNGEFVIITVIRVSSRINFKMSSLRIPLIVISHKDDEFFMSYLRPQNYELHDAK